MNAPADAALMRLPSETQSLIDALIAFIDQRDCTDVEFDALAVRIFAHQYANNETYRRFSQRRAITPRKVRTWRDVPPVPIAAFKETTLSAAPIEFAERIFMTSGTTRAEVRGRHYHPTLAVYDRSMTRNFAARFIAPLLTNPLANLPADLPADLPANLPADLAANRDRVPMAILFPDEATLPNSSLAHYLSLAVATFGTGESRHFIDDRGIDVDGFRDWVDAVRASGQPCAVLGATYSFVHVIDAFGGDASQRLSLPEGSCILDTGGYKRQSRELPAHELYECLSAAFGVPRSRCINMYGMTELSTQFYDDGNGTVPSVKSGPHWIRSRTIDPLSGRDVAAGERGVLVHCDLANFNSTVAILTEDVGRMVAGADAGADARYAFELLGRVEGAEAKGCSLAVQAFVEAANGAR